MNQHVNDLQRERQKNFFLFLPFILIPLLALAFWALGGGRGSAPALSPEKQGINLDLPGPRLPEEQPGKMSLYERMEKDSVRNGGHDPLRMLASDTLRHAADRNEAAINERLDRIKKQLAEPVASGDGHAVVAAGNVPEDSGTAKLEKMMQVIQTPQAADPEMAQLSAMLDKIISIQQPAVHRGTVETGGVSGDAVRVPDSAFRAIPAIIDGNQKVAPGAAVNLVLRDSVRLGNVFLPKGQKLSGLCQVTNQRLLLEIRNIRLGTSIIPASLTVFSLDGMQGIPAPEAELGQAAGNGLNNALSGMQLVSADQSIGTQAATAGISAATSLLGKKIKKIRVKLKGGQVVLLRNNH